MRPCGLGAGTADLYCEIFHAGLFGLIFVSRCGLGDNILVAFNYCTSSIVLSELWQVVEKFFQRCYE
jgi:hypothetical protein